MKSSCFLFPGLWLPQRENTNIACEAPLSKPFQCVLSRLLNPAPSGLSTSLALLYSQFYYISWFPLSYSPSYIYYKVISWCDNRSMLNTFHSLNYSLKKAHTVVACRWNVLADVQGLLLVLLWLSAGTLQPGLAPEACGRDPVHGRKCAPLWPNHGGAGCGLLNTP